MKKTWLFFLLLVVVAIGAFAYSNNNGGSLTSIINNVMSYVAYHNKHKELETMVESIDPNQWFAMKFGLLANEKVIINTRETAPSFTAHYIINDEPGSQNLYELLCYADDDTPAFPTQQGSPRKVEAAKIGFYREVCNQKAESVMRWIAGAK